MFLKTLTLLGFLAGATAASAAPPSPSAVTMPAVPDNGSLRVTVKVLQPQVKVGRTCPVELNVINISSRVQSFRTFGCSWEEQWKVSNKDLNFPTTPCRWNPLRRITLKPGETFRRNSDLLVSAKPGTIRFHVVFQPVDNRKIESNVAGIKIIS